MTRIARGFLAASLCVGTPVLAQEHTHGSDEGAATPAHQKHPLDAQAPKPTGTAVELKLEGGQPAAAYVARPMFRARGAVLVLHEWWGLNDWIRTMADQLAQEGYLALAVDLYKGKVATNPKEATALMQGLDEAHGDRVEEAGLEWLKAHATGIKVATVGWCMGGGQSLNASLHDPKDVNATVMYYGMPVTDVAKLKTLKGPLLGIWAKQDGWINTAKVQEFDKALTDAGIKHEFHDYDADHAFANPSGGKYNGPFAKDAWQKTLAFLKANVG